MKDSTMEEPNSNEKESPLPSKEPPPFVGVDVEQHLIKLLSNNKDRQQQYEALRAIRNLVIGIKSAKSLFVKHGLLNRVIEILDGDVEIDIAIEGAVILGSLARGDTDVLKELLDSRAIETLCKCLQSENEKLVLASLRSLRTCFLTNQVTAGIIYNDPRLVPTLQTLLQRTSQHAECTANILLRSCKNMKDQMLLYETGTVTSLSRWLLSNNASVLIPVIGTLSVIVCANEQIANNIVQDESLNIVNRLLSLMSGDRTEEIQLEASVCLSKLYRASTVTINCNELETKVLAVLVRMCHEDKPNYIRIIAASSLAYLIEDNPQLQETAATSNHLVKTIATYFHETQCKQTSDGLKESAFKVFASLSSNEERIRVQIAESSPSLIKDIHCAINQESNASLQAAGLQCLLSLSRSVKQLHTTIQDCKLWQPVILALKSSTSDDVISVSSSVLCNLLLHFSPCKETLVEFGALEVLSALIQRSEPAFRVNGVWGLMNLASDSDGVLKNRILDFFGMENILRLIEDSSIEVALKALGTIRNLLTGKEQDIDGLIREHGQLIVAAVTPLVMQDDVNAKLKEQALCLLSNVANGGKVAKDLLLNEEQLVRKIIGYMTSCDEALQVACVFCIANLYMGGREEARFDKLRALGAEKQFAALKLTANSTISEKVKFACSQFIP